MRTILHNNRTDRWQPGVALVELMIALVLGMLVVLAVTTVVLTSKSAQSTQIDASNTQDTARYALNNIARSVRQAGFVNYDKNDGPYTNTEFMTPSITGVDARSLKATSTGIESPVASANNSSDILAIRFFGSGTGVPDNTVLSCSGFGVSAPSTSEEDERRWSIYYVANDSNGEPNLYCKYKDRTDRNFATVSIAQGVESFQVLYGIDTSSPANGIANQFLNATEIDALDIDISAAELNKKTHWKKITAIKVALLIRGTENSSFDTTATTFNLFGEKYSKSRNGADKGIQFIGADFPATHKNRLRKSYSTTIQIRNPLN
jgi:type IV pilus assembly protein PilW